MPHAAGFSAILLCILLKTLPSSGLMKELFQLIQYTFLKSHRKFQIKILQLQYNEKSPLVPRFNHRRIPVFLEAGKHPLALVRESSVVWLYLKDYEYI